MTHSDGVIITADKRQIKISPILLYALFMAHPPNNYNDHQYFWLYVIRIYSTGVNWASLIFSPYTVKSTQGLLIIIKLYTLPT